MNNLVSSFIYECKIRVPKFGSFTKCLLVNHTARAVLVAGIHPVFIAGKPSYYRPAWVPLSVIEIKPEPLIECSECHAIVPKPADYNPNRRDNTCPNCKEGNLRAVLKVVGLSDPDIEAALKKMAEVKP